MNYLIKTDNQLLPSNEIEITSQFVAVLIPLNGFHIHFSETTAWFELALHNQFDQSSLTKSFKIEKDIVFLNINKYVNHVIKL